MAVSFSRPTLIAAAEAAGTQYQADFNQMVLRLGLEDEIPSSTQLSVAKKCDLLGRVLVKRADDPVETVDGAVTLGEAVVREAAVRANMTPYSEQELNEMKRRCDGFEARFGKDMHNEYGWASTALNNPKPNFAQFEKAVGLDHWRPRYRWASQHTHGGYRPPLAMLGTAETVDQVHLVGQSNSGFMDPIHMAAITLNQATSSLLLLRPSVDNIVFVKIVTDLADEIGDAALGVEKRAVKEAKPKRKPQKRKSSARKGVKRKRR